MSRFKVLFVYPNVSGSMLIPIHIPLLSACLKREGFDVELFDTTYYSVGVDFEKEKERLLMLKPFERGQDFRTEKQCYTDLVDMVDSYRPNLVAFSVVEDTIPFALRLAEEVTVGIPIVFGGVGATFNKERLLDVGIVDYVCVGEGEKALVELCRALEEGDGEGVVNNIVTPFRRKVVLNTLIDLETLPVPDFSIFPEKRLNRVMHGELFKMLHVEIDRGCPFACSYCESPALTNLYRKEKQSGYYRQKSAEKVMADFTEIKRLYNPDYFDFDSETFLARETGKFLRLMSQYKKEIDLPFWCQTRLETVDHIKIKALKDAGVADMQFGIESANDALRRSDLNRIVGNDVMFNAIRIVEDAKIKYSLNFIIGFPNETRKTVFESINFFKACNSEFAKTANVYIAVAYKGTALYDYCITNDLLEEGHSTHTLLGGSPIKLKNISREEILGLQRTFSLHARMGDEFLEEIELAEEIGRGDIAFEDLSKIYVDRYY